MICRALLPGVASAFIYLSATPLTSERKPENSSSVNTSVQLVKSSISFFWIGISAGKVSRECRTDTQQRHLHGIAGFVLDRQGGFVQLINAFDRAADPIFPHDRKDGAVREDFYMPIQARAWNVRQCVPEFLDRTCLMKQEILENSLPDRIHHDFNHLHALSPLLELFYVYIIFSILRISRAFLIAKCPRAFRSRLCRLPRRGRELGLYAGERAAYQASM